LDHQECPLETVDCALLSEVGICIDDSSGGIYYYSLYSCTSDPKLRVGEIVAVTFHRVNQPCCCTIFIGKVHGKQLVMPSTSVDSLLNILPQIKYIQQNLSSGCDNLGAPTSTSYRYDSTLIIYDYCSRHTTHWSFPGEDIVVRRGRHVVSTCYIWRGEIIHLVVHDDSGGGGHVLDVGSVHLHATKRLKIPRGSASSPRQSSVWATATARALAVCPSPVGLLALVLQLSCAAHELASAPSASSSAALTSSPPFLRASAIILCAARRLPMMSGSLSVSSKRKGVRT